MAALSIHKIFLTRYNVKPEIIKCSEKFFGINHNLQRNNWSGSIQNNSSKQSIKHSLKDIWNVYVQCFRFKNLLRVNQRKKTPQYVTQNERSTVVQSCHDNAEQQFGKITWEHVPWLDYTVSSSNLWKLFDGSIWTLKFLIRDFF